MNSIMVFGFTYGICKINELEILITYIWKVPKSARIMRILEKVCKSYFFFISYHLSSLFLSTARHMPLPVNRTTSTINWSFWPTFTTLPKRVDIGFYSRYSPNCVAVIYWRYFVSRLLYYPWVAFGWWLNNNYS